MNNGMDHGASVFQGRLFITLRWIARRFKRRVATPAPIEFTRPAVYIGHHQNTKGPLNTMIWLPVPVRLWSFNVFLDREKCERQYETFTFSKRFGWPRPVARLAAKGCAAPVTGIMRSSGAIAVYRKDEAAKTVKTFRETLAALDRGERVLIYPDVDYHSADPRMGEVYHGFLYLEKYYFRKTGEHLPFIPLYYDARGRRIRLGEAVRFPDGDMDGEIDNVSRLLVEGINKLARDSI